MIEATGNLWMYPADLRVITTNGTVRSDGCAVMGRGCAKEATQRFSGIQLALGLKLRATGNHVYYFPEYGLFTFPVKHHWSEAADLSLIKQSARELHWVLHDYRIVMPRPGCGNGRLPWEMVKPLLIGLPDTVTVITFGEEEMFR